MNINENEKAKVLMFVDDAFAYGIEKNHYRNTYKSHPELKIVGISEAPKYNLIASENEIFYYNPFQQIYLTQSDDLNTQFYNAKLLCYINVFRYMGAISVSGEVGSIRSSKSKKEMNVNAKYENVGVGSDVKSSKEEEIRKSLKINRTFVGNLIKSKEEIKDYISKFDLWNDMEIKSLYDQYKIENKLTGSYEREISLASDLNKSLDIAANLNYAKIFQLDSTFKSIIENRLEVLFKINVQFSNQ